MEVKQTDKKSSKKMQKDYIKSSGLIDGGPDFAPSMELVRAGLSEEHASSLTKAKLANSLGGQGLDDVVLTKLDLAVNWGRKNSLWPFIFGTACCAIEFMAAVDSEHDIARYGAEVVRYSPRQADLMIVAGTIPFKQAPILKEIYEQMAEPKWVIAMGACACSGGFYDNYTTVQGIDTIIPVDMYVAGCPPRPEGLFDAILALQEKVQNTKYDPNRHANFRGIFDD